MFLLVYLKLSLYVFKLRQGNIVLILSVINSCDLFQDNKRVLRREIDDKIIWRFFDIEDKEQ